MKKSNKKTAKSASQQREKLKAYLVKAKGTPVSMSDLCDLLDRSQSTVEDLLLELEASGHPLTKLKGGRKVKLASTIKPGNKIVHDVSAYVDQAQMIGVTGDNHMGSKHERMDVLNALYDVYEAEGVKVVYNTGNWIEGVCRFNQHDINIWGMDNQINYWVDNYPQRKGITTKFVAGDDHEGWWQKKEQIEIGRYAEMCAVTAGREDLVYLGYVEADIEMKMPKGSAWLRVMHPGGGSSYALSYSSQKIVESLQGGEKPNILLIGHYHKFDYCFPREVHCVQTGCTVDQSIFMRRCKLQAHVGGVLLRVTQNEQGHVVRLGVDWMPFYNKTFYNKRIFSRGKGA